MSFDEITKKLNPKIASLWVALNQSNKCIWCNHKFKEGITRKYKKQVIPIDAYWWFTADFLVHAQTTHGYSPDIIQDFLYELSKKS